MHFLYSTKRCNIAYDYVRSTQDTRYKMEDDKKIKMEDDKKIKMVDDKDISKWKTTKKNKNGRPPKN